MTGTEGVGTQRCGSTCASSWRSRKVCDHRHCPAALPPGKSPGTHCGGDSVGLRTFLVGYGVKENPCRHASFMPLPSSTQRVALPVTFSRPLFV
jgi:hypothetical protein